MRDYTEPEMRNVKCFIDDQDIINVVFNGDLSVESDDSLSRAVGKASAYLRAANLPAIYLSDVRHLGKMPPAVKKRAYKNIMAFDLDRRAYLSAKTGVVTAMMNMIVGVFNEGKPGQFKVFHDESSARAWLLELRK
jgi:hypothetical protein